MRYISRIVVVPHLGEPYETMATVSKYEIVQNGELPLLEERLRFRMDLDKFTVRLGDRIIHDKKEWVVGAAGISHAGNRVIADGSRQALDTAQCVRVQVYRWRSQYGCNAGEEPELVHSGLHAGIASDGLKSRLVNDSRSPVSAYRIYLEDATGMDHLTMVRSPERDFRVKEVKGLGSPGRLPWLVAEESQVPLAAVTDG